MKGHGSNRDDGRIRPGIHLREGPGKDGRQEGTSLMTNPVFKEQLHLGSEMTSGIYRKAIGLEIVK
jgi:hypothetical protein